MKKLISLVLSLGLVLFALGCTSAATSVPTPTTNTQQSSSAAADTAEENTMAQPGSSDMMVEVMPKDIVDIAVEDGRFTVLVAAVEAAALVETLKSEGPFTVFAPTDEAFAKLPEGTVETLLADIPALTNVLLYHVVSGNVMAADVVTLESANTVQGQPVAIVVADGQVIINESMVVITDIQASNGVIHVIDTVLLPPTT